MKGMDDFFDISYSNEMLAHLDKVNMDPWFYVYTNYVNPLQKKESKILSQKTKLR